PQTNEDFPSCPTWQMSRSHELHYPSANQLGFALGTIKVVQGSSWCGYRTHCLPSRCLTVSGRLQYPSIQPSSPPRSGLPSAPSSSGRDCLDCSSNCRSEPGTGFGSPSAWQLVLRSG